MTRGGLYLEAIKKTISVDKNTANETMQLLLEGEVIVPDSKGDMQRIISCAADCFVRPCGVNGNRLEFSGSADIDIIYLCKNQNAVGMSGTAAINDFMVIEGLDKNSTVQLDCNIISVDCNVQNERKAAYKLLIEVSCHVFDTYCGDVVESIDGLNDENMFINDINYTNLISKQPGSITVREQLKIGKEKPNIDSIVRAFAQPVNINAACADEGVKITGDLKLTFLYNGAEGGDPLEVFTDEVPINGCVEVGGAREDMLCSPDIKVEKLFYSVLADEDGESRVIDIECELCIYPNVFGSNNVKLLDDAYCLDRFLELECRNIEAFRAICCNNSQCPIKQPVETDGADMLQIYCVTGDVTVDNVSVMQDKTLVEGVLTVNVLYVTGNDSDPVCGFKGDIPFSHTLETLGSTECMTALVNAAPQHIGFNMLSQREVEIRGMLAINCVVIENTAFTVVTNVKERPVPDGFFDSLPSVTVYIVKKGDTLWKLAKRFNTTVSEIAKINGIEDVDLIHPGDRLLILKGAA